MRAGATHISPVVLRQEVGRRIRLARHEAGLTIVEAAERLELTRSALSRLEDFVALETGASRISNYELTFVPGLLQTADYARALFRSSWRARSDEWIANRLAVRLTRQERLTDEEHPLELDAVMHEIALPHGVGEPAIMRNQLQHLALINELPTVTLRILPAVRVSSEAMIGPFSVLDFPMVGQPSISYALHALGEERRDKSEHVEPARLRFTHLRSLALDPDESVALIERTADELWSS